MLIERSATYRTRPRSGREDGYAGARPPQRGSEAAATNLTTLFLDVARPPSRDPPPGDRLPGGPEIRPGVGARPGNVKEPKILNAAPLRRLQHEKHPFLLVRCRWHRAVPARVVPTNSMTMVIKPNVYNAMESPFKVGTLKHACYTVLSDAGERGARVR
eukprot:1183877-Prorocentrum_minimum.AAC.3